MTDVAGQRLLEIAAQHVGETYRLGAQVPKGRADYRGPWDCAELASDVLELAGVARLADGRIYGCDATGDAYTGYWATDAKVHGTIIPISRAATIAGAFVLRVPGHIGGHIVLSDGSGGTVEAHSTRTGVIRSSLQGRRWDLGILPPGVDYGGAGDDVHGPRAVILPPRFVVLRCGDTGPKVREIQAELVRLGIDAGPADGEFGARTEAGVRAFQDAHGLVPDGEVGSATAAALGITLPLA